MTARPATDRPRVAPALRRGLAGVLLALFAAEALARAGGGGNFGGGGGGGGGFGGGDFGGGGGDGGEALVHLLILLWRYPAIGVPLVIVLAVLFVISARQGRVYQQTRVIRAARPLRSQFDDVAATSRLRQSDPAFDRSAFFSRVVLAFRRAQKAWCAQDLTEIRPFVSDGIHERFALQIQEQQDLGYRDEMDQLDVASVEFADVFEEGGAQIVTLRIVASAVDRRVALEGGRVLQGSGAPQRFSEYWSFLRRLGARSRAADALGLLEGHCANCGAPVALNQWSKCEHCGAMLRSGEHDWVLVEITQEGEWRPHAAEVLPGLAALRARDPELSVQHLEDRVSVMYWRTAMSERLGDTRPMRKMATDDLCARWQVHIDEGRRPDGTRHYFGERGVGSVAVLGFVTGPDRDRALVDVRWTGTLFSVDAQGRRTRQRQSSVISTLLVVDRDAAARSDPGTTVASAHCTNCGAPETGGTGDACEYCGEVMNDGRRTWVLADVVPRNTDAGRALLDSLRSPTRAAPLGERAVPTAATEQPGARALIAWLALGSMADGALDERESERLRGMAARSGVAARDVDKIVAAAREGTLDAPAPIDVEEARLWLREVAVIALADGRLEPGESALLESLGRSAGLLPADVRLALGDARARLYRESREAQARERRRQEAARRYGSDRNAK